METSLGARLLWITIIGFFILLILNRTPNIVFRWLDKTKSKRKYTAFMDRTRDLRIRLEAALAPELGIAKFPDEILYTFEDVKPYNLDFSFTPAAVTYPKTPDQVSVIVKFAAKHEYKVQARSGGHGYGNHCIGGQDGAIVIDLKHFQQFSMDDQYNATIGAGTLVDNVTRRLFNAGGRAIAHGVCPQVGCGGHFTTGGFGPMSRMWGTALDHVIAIQVVLADGRIVRASDSENTDIFFAIKGAAASFGIVTEFTVRTHPAPTEAVRYSFSLETSKFKSLGDTFKAWQKFVSDPKLDRRLYTQVTLSTNGMVVSGTFFGSRADFNALGLEDVFPHQKKSNMIVFQDWLALVAHWLEEVGLHLIGGVQSAFCVKCLALKYADVIPSSGVDELLEYLERAYKGTIFWFVNFELQGGAINDTESHTCAYIHRDVMLYTAAHGVDTGRVNCTMNKFIRGINMLIRESLPRKELGCYPGYVDTELKDPQRAYWGANLPKLERIKKEIDPDDVFHNPQTVRLPLSKSAKIGAPLKRGLNWVAKKSISTKK